MRIATARATSLNATTPAPVKSASEPSSFFALLASAEAQPERTSAATGVCALPAESGSDSRAANHSAQFHLEVPEETDTIPGQLQTHPAAVAARRLALPALPAASKGVPSYSSDSGEPKPQSHSDAAPLNVVAHAVLAPALPVPASPLVFLAPGSALQVSAQTESAAAAPIDNAKTLVGTASEHFVGVSAVPEGDRLQAKGNPLVAEAGTGKTNLTQQEPADSSAPVTAAAPALAGEIAAADPASGGIPFIALLPAFGEDLQLPREAAQSSIANASASSNAGSAKAFNDISADGKDKTSQSSSAASAAHSADGNTAGAQRPDANSAQPAADAAKPADSISPQGTPVQAALHAASAPPGHADTAPQPSRPGGQPAAAQTPETANPSVVNSASLIQKISQTEMRVDVHSPDYGAISIRTSLSPQQMTTQITVDHDELSKVISAHVPTMEATLGSDCGVRALVEVNQSAMSFSGGGGNAQQGGQKNFSTGQAPVELTSAPEESDDSGRHFAAVAAGSNRLDIRA